MAKISTKKRTPSGQDPVYMGAKDGPFSCSNCEYFTFPKFCRKEEMEKAQNVSPAIVESQGCCNYFEKK